MYHHVLKRLALPHSIFCGELMLISKVASILKEQHSLVGKQNQ